MLDSGPYDLGRTPSAYLADDETLIVTGSWLEAFIDLALPHRTVDERRAPDDPRSSQPRFRVLA